MIVIAGHAITIRDYYTEISPAEIPTLGVVLREIWLTEIQRRLDKTAEKFLNDDDLPSILHIEAQRLQCIDILADLNLDPNSAAIDAESIEIATEQIIAELAKHNLPAPPRLRAHAETLAQNNQEIRSEARRRVEAKLAASAALINEHRENLREI